MENSETNEGRNLDQSLNSEIYNKKSSKSNSSVAASTNNISTNEEGKKMNPGSSEKMDEEILAGEKKDAENQRKIIAENPSHNLLSIKKLVTICLEMVVKKCEGNKILSYLENLSLKRIPKKFRGT